MNLAHVHIVLNHIPSLGSLAGLVALAAGVYTKNEQLKRFAFLALVLVSLSILPTYITGGEAQRMVQAQPAVSKAMIQIHQNAAMVTLFFITLAGAFAWFGLWEIRRFGHASSVSTAGTLLMATITVAVILYTASLGGKISHPEVREPEDAAVTEAAGWREPIELAVSDNSWVWPAAEILHYIGMCALFGISGLLMIRMLGGVKSIPFTALHRLLPFGALGFVINVYTGMLFFIAGPGNYIGKSGFHMKIASLLVGAIPVLYFTVFDDPWKTGSGKNASVLSRVVAVAGFVLLIATILYGRFLPFLT